MNGVDASRCNPGYRNRNWAGQFAAGSAVILLGLVFLANNLGIGFPLFGWHNWWALFILVAAATPAARAIDRYRRVGAVDAGVVQCVVSAIIVVTVALMFLLDVSFALWWPIFLVLSGLSMLVSGGWRRDCK
ncbi:MAG TPA: hypothetical protein VK660_08395 [Xanthomonadaceae bacterium]|jgi:hypothetical protein|nr:hypothetical protein [Xanthomonadaceae bacterium]